MTLRADVDKLISEFGEKWHEGFKTMTPEMWLMAFPPATAVGYGVKGAMAARGAAKVAPKIGEWMTGRFIPQAEQDALRVALAKEGIPKTVKAVTKSAVTKRAAFNIQVREAEKAIMKSAPLRNKIVNFLKNKWTLTGIGAGAVWIMSTNMWAEWAAADNISQGIGMAVVKLTDIHSRLSLVEDEAERARLEKELEAHLNTMEASLVFAEEFSEISQNNPLIAWLAPTFHQAIKVARINFDLAKTSLGVPPTVYGRTPEQIREEGEISGAAFERGQQIQRGVPFVPSAEGPRPLVPTEMKAAFNQWLVDVKGITPHEAERFGTWENWQEYTYQLAKPTYEKQYAGRVTAMAGEAREKAAVIGAGVGRTEITPSGGVSVDVLRERELRKKREAVEDVFKPKRYPYG